MKWLDAQLPFGLNNERMETDYYVMDQITDISGQILLYFMIIAVTLLFATIHIAEYYGALVDGKIQSGIEKGSSSLREYFTPNATPAPEPRRASYVRQRK